MERHCPAGGHGQGSVDEWKKRRPGGPPSPLYLCSLKSSPSCIPKEKEKGAEPHPPPPRSGRGGPPAPLLPSPVATRGFQPLSTGSLSSPPGLVQSSEGFSSQPASLSGKETASPLSTPAPVSTPGLWLGRGEPGEAGASSPQPPGVAPPNLGTGRRGCPAKAPRAGDRARRPPPPLPAGEGCPAAGTPGVGSECAPRGCAARCCPALPRGRGALGRAHPGPLSAALAPAGGAGWAAGARLPRPRSGSRAPLRPPGLRGARLRPGRPPPPSHALARRDRASLLSLRLRSPLRLLPPPASRANLRTGLTLQTSASGLGQKRGSGTGRRGWRPGRGAPARWPGAATWSGHPP